MPGYVYATKGDVLYVNLFAAGTARVDVAGKKAAVTQETRYPWDGKVAIEVEPEKTSEFALHIRLPGWARNRPVPGDLYGCPEKGDAKTMLGVNGEPVGIDLEMGFARIRRRWRKGDEVVVEFPMEARQVAANGSVGDDAGKVAVQRGPLVYCAEWPDNGGRVLDLALTDRTPLIPEWRADMLGGVVVLKGKGARREAPEETRDLILIPYYAWAHRGPGEMAVWLKLGTQY